MKILVEGESDKAAVDAVAARLGVRANVVSTDGVTNFGRHLDGAVGGLYDVAEAELVAGALGVGVNELVAHGFFACDRDLEDELLRSIGPDVVLDIAEQEGDLRRFRTLQQQPEWRDRPVHEQLRRWFGSGGSRKVRYARLIAERLDLDRLPHPLLKLMGHVRAS